MSPSTGNSNSTSETQEDDDDNEDYDERPLISDLLLKHSKDIENVRNKIKDEELYRKDTDDTAAAAAAATNSSRRRRYDDIWILRYVLSHAKDNDNFDGAADAAIQTMIFRDEKNLNNVDLRYRMLNSGDKQDIALFNSMSMPAGAEAAEPLPHWKKVNDCCGENAAFFIQPDPNRGTVLVFDLGAFDMDLTHDAFSYDEVLEHNVYTNECVFQVLDDVTRRTGKLTKMCKIIDIGSTRLSKINRSYLKRDGEVSKELENMYPQLVGTLLVLNSPSWMSIIWSFAKLIMPKRMVSKIDFLPAVKKQTKKKSSSLSSSSTKSTSSHTKKHLKPFLKYISEEHLPEKYGGMNKLWPLECFGRVYQKQMSVADK